MSTVNESLVTPPISKNHWQDHASQWSLITSPLRPCDEDVVLFQKYIENTDQSALLLGVTPELQHITHRVCAVDNNHQMLEQFAGTHLKVIQRDWQAMQPIDLSDAPFRYILADGSFNAIHMNDWAVLLRKFSWLLEPKGRLISRFFISPDKAEDMADVFYQAKNRHIPNFAAFKWQFIMALVARRADPNIHVSHVHVYFEKLIPDRIQFSEQTGWPLAAINTIDNYKHSTCVYNFPTMAQLHASIKPYLNITSVECGSYYLAERCPIMTFTPCHD